MTDRRTITYRVTGSFAAADLDYYDDDGESVEREAVPLGDCSQSIYVARISVDVHRDDCGRSRRDRCLNVRRIDAVGFGIDIAKDRLEFFPRDGMHRGAESERGRDHLAAQAQRAI